MWTAAHVDVRIDMGHNLRFNCERAPCGVQCDGDTRHFVALRAEETATHVYPPPTILLHVGSEQGKASGLRSSAGAPTDAGRWFRATRASQVSSRRERALGIEHKVKVNSARYTHLLEPCCMPVPAAKQIGSRTWHLHILRRRPGRKKSRPSRRQTSTCWTSACGRRFSNARTSTRTRSANLRCRTLRPSTS